MKVGLFLSGFNLSTIAAGS